MGLFWCSANCPLLTHHLCSSCVRIPSRRERSQGGFCNKIQKSYFIARHNLLFCAWLEKFSQAWVFIIILYYQFSVLYLVFVFPYSILFVDVECKYLKIIIIQKKKSLLCVELIFRS
jgi:hypothetical protein